MQITVRILLITILQISLAWQLSDPLGKSLKQVIALRGSDYKKIRDASGYPGLFYKKVIQNKSATDTIAVSELLYFENDTCFKDVSILPENLADNFIDSFNRQFQPAGFNSWFRNDSSFVTLSKRDGFLDITSFTSGYYKNPH